MICYSLEYQLTQINPLGTCWLASCKMANSAKRIRLDRNAIWAWNVHARALPAKPSLILLLVELHCQSCCQRGRVLCVPLKPPQVPTVVQITLAEPLVWSSKAILLTCKLSLLVWDISHKNRLSQAITMTSLSMLKIKYNQVIASGKLDVIVQFIPKAPSFHLPS